MSRPTKFTVKIFGEGQTEWFYFDKLRSKKLFTFSLEPGLPVKSRSSYKKRLLLIDKELERPEDERANLIVLVTDLDNIVCDSAQHKEYLEDKARYEARGVVFVESHPCIELWFLYHFTPRYEKSTYATYDEIKQPLREHLPKYEKSKDYYSGNSTFREAIVESLSRRVSAAGRADASCRYPVAEGEIANYTNIHRLVMFLHMMQYCYTFSDILHARIHSAFSIEPEVENLGKIDVKAQGEHLLTLKAERDKIYCCAGAMPVELPLEFHYGDLTDELHTLLATLEAAVKGILASK